MDAFFAAVEQRDFLEYRNKPIAIGYNMKRSVVSTASYEARKYGVHSALPVSIALRKCPQLIIVPPRYEVYKSISTKIRRIFYEYTDLVEPLSIDEAYLDVTHPKKGKNSASLLAMEIKKRIKEETNLIASAGVSYNKFLAKVASDQDKPDGFFLITPQTATSFLENLDIGLFYGIGKVTEQKRGKTITLKIKYPDFTNMTRSSTKNELILETENLVNLAYALLSYEKIKEKKVRLIGVSIFEEYKISKYRLSFHL